VLVAPEPAAPPEPEAERVGPPESVPETGRAPLSPWALVGIALGVLAVAHVGLWLLLTASARSGVAEAEERYEPDEMERALAAADAPPATAPDPGLADLRRQQLVEAARRWSTDQSHVSTVGYALLAAFLAQAAIVVALKLRSGRSGSPSRRSARGRATRAAG
jgi:hypothetical protein